MRNKSTAGTLDKKETKQFEALVRRLENSGVADYVKLSQNTPKILWFNFLSGIARGLGFTVGTAVVLAVVYKVISGLIEMNIPYLKDLLIQFMEIVKGGQAI